jgi:exopolyphosphatase/guanosine-5'-triphosphate,3'-diphosphate pyrophosphatase
MRRAVVDVGSNSVLLVVAERTDGLWRTITETSEVTGLGTDTKATSLLRPDAQQRTLAAVLRAFNKASELSAHCTAAVTMAARIATNANEFLSAAREQGTPVVVLSGEEEARLGLLSVMNDPEFQSFERISVIDPGGQSTELTTAARTSVGFETLFSKSFPVGALALRDGPMGADSPDAAARFSASYSIDALIDTDFEPGFAGVAVGLGATATNLVTIRGSITEWDAERVHGQRLTYEEVSRAAAWMSDMAEAERAKIVGLEAGREKTIHIGALILERFMNAIHVSECFVSTRGWRHALLDIDDLFRETSHS